MLIPLIAKDPTKNDFTCRDGEIEITVRSAEPVSVPDASDPIYDSTGYGVRFSLETALPYPTATIRVPLQSGDGSKLSLMLAGEGLRVDAAAADRISQAVVAKAAVAFADILTDARAAGLFMLPFRAFAAFRGSDGAISLPSATAILLPGAFPPHPEIIASHVEDDGATLSLRIPVRPQRLKTILPESFVANDTEVCTFVSRGLWVPDAKEISGSLGSVRTADGSSGMGIRFSFMTDCRIKASVVAPDKYYRYIGNDAAGYHTLSDAIKPPDYESYRMRFGTIPLFAADSLCAVDSDVDPLVWIGDWRRAGEGYLPIDTEASSEFDFDTAVSRLDTPLATLVAEMKAMTGYGNWILTRPMTFAADERSRHRAEATAPSRLAVYGMPQGVGAVGILLGSSDGVNYLPVLSFDPQGETALLAPRRPFWRLLLGSSKPLPALCLMLNA